MKKLSSYLSAGIAATATFQSSDAATVVTLYGPGAKNPSTTPATPVGIAIGNPAINDQLDAFPYKGSNSFFARSVTGQYFTTGTDLTIKTSGGYGDFYDSDTGNFLNGANSGSANYVNISFNGNDGVYEAVGQFNIQSQGNSYLIALAINDDGSELSISAGKAAIDAVPEPSAIALLALGAGGMAMRRRRKVA